MAKISVVIPVYNVESYLDATLQSVLQQSFHDFEAICINDGSDDSSEEILWKYAKQDERIKVISQRNGGVSMARNMGLQNAGGEYICFLDADDVLHPQFLELLYNAIAQTKADVAWCEYVSISSDDVNLQKFDRYQLNRSLQTYPNILECLIARHPNPQVSLWNKLYKTDMVRGSNFDAGIKVAEDYIWLHKVLYHSKLAVYVPEVLYFYRIRPGSAMQSAFSTKIVDDHLFCVTGLVAYFKQHPINPVSMQKLETLLAKMCLKYTCLMPRRRDKKNYMMYWQKYAPIVAGMVQNKEINITALNLKNRLKIYLFCHEKFGWLKCIIRI